MPLFKWFDRNKHCLTKGFTGLLYKQGQFLFEWWFNHKEILVGGSNPSQKYACQLGTQPQVCLKMANVGNYPVDDITLGGTQVRNFLCAVFFAITRIYRSTML